MAEEFEGDLTGAVFWGADLTGARFRDVDLTGVHISHARVVDVEIDAFVDRITINGVDVTEFVNERDRWYPLRAMMRPADPEGMRRAWDALEPTWNALIERARRLPDPMRHESVDGEFSFVDTLRHLVFCIDKWFTAPILGEETFDPIGKPNTGSIGFGFPGLDLDATPTFDDVLAVRAEKAARFRSFLDGITSDDLTREVVVLENGPNPIAECIYTVFEEEFEHNRYADRDLTRLEER